MADLRALLSGLEFEDVRTLLQSGNAVFTVKQRSPQKMAASIEAAIKDELGMEVRCLVRTGPELHAASEGHPFADLVDDGRKMLAHFVSAPPDPKLLKEHDPEALDPARIRVGDGVIYQWCPNGILEAPPVPAFVEKHLGIWVTARNWNTVLKLSAMLDEG